MADISIYAISCFYFVSAYLTIEEKSYTGKITAERFIYFTIITNVANVTMFNALSAAFLFLNAFFESRIY